MRAKKEQENGLTFSGQLQREERSMIQFGEGDVNYFCLRYSTVVIPQGPKNIYWESSISSSVWWSWKCWKKKNTTAWWMMSSATKLSCLMRRWGETDPKMRRRESFGRGAALLKNVQPMTFSVMHITSTTWMQNDVLLYVSSDRQGAWYQTQYCLSAEFLSAQRWKMYIFQTSVCSKQSAWQILQQCLKPPFQSGI